MNIKKTFLKLTKKTYPYGFEDELQCYLPKGYVKDIHGNYYYKIGESRTAFTCHLDTACKSQVNVSHRIENNKISTDGTSILGADDKAGMTVMLYMIDKKVPGLYCFFIGEESGCIGSGKASDDTWFTNYDRMISFDRRGTSSIITYQSYKRCCSNEFANALAAQLNQGKLHMSPDDTGVYTDSAEFTGVIPECTNISVGYYNEHTNREYQDIEHLINLCLTCVKVDWESLPIKRKVGEIDYKSYSSSYNGWGNYGVSTDYYGSRKGGYGTHIVSKKYRKKYVNNFHDEYDPLNKHYYEDFDSEYVRVYDKNVYEGLKYDLSDVILTENDLNKLCDQYFDFTKKEDIDRFCELSQRVSYGKEI